MGSALALRAVIARPSLWRAALRQVRALAPTGWWRRPPFLPVPDRAWLSFRLTTAYGDPTAPIVADDLVAWLRWSDTVQPAAETAIRPDETRR
ncbi:MAG: hypothetical protein U5K30_01155 [Acidimicrobiales bacterium]|nr:hypothetical protein [Acidimicrobiales bacterium]